MSKSNSNSMSTEIRVYAATVMSTVYQLLEKGGPDAWLIGTRIEVNDYNSDDELPSVGGVLTVACYAPANYVHVLANFNDRPVMPSNYGSLQWQPIVCHDSCWRSDGVESVIRSAANQVVAEASSRFKQPESELSLHLSMTHLAQHQNAELLLQSGLLRNERHGSLILNIA